MANECPRKSSMPQSGALLGLFGGGNIGNEASLIAMLTPLRSVFPETVIACICGKPAAVTQRYSIPAIPILQTNPAGFIVIRSRAAKFLYRFFVKLPAEIKIWFNTFRYLRTLEFVIIPGTGILDDYRLDPFGVPYSLLRWCLVARFARTKLLFVSIGAGPIRHPLSRFFMKTAARCATYRSYRDKVSRDYMERLGVDASKDPIYPDIVFSLPRPSLSAEGFNSAEGKQTTIGIGVMSYYGWQKSHPQGELVYKTYIGKLARFIQWLVDREYTVRLIIGETSDQAAADDLLAAVQMKGGNWLPPKFFFEPARTIWDVFKQMSETRIVIASRFHNVISALMLNRPVLSLGYAEKNAALMTEMGLAKYCQDIEEFDVEMLIEQFREVEKNEKALSDKIREKNREYRISLDRQFAEVFSALKLLEPKE
jgi:polysaccharide pyruvyl transferase WcaK-like protein